MNNIIHSIKDSDEVNWIDFSIILGNAIKSSRENKDDKNDLIMELFYYIFCFARQNNINMQVGWNRWNTKVDFKHYF